ncbi:hypothetical protein GCM10022222_51190 [Amycolatopsis ultiminotia]|uniref:DUF4913 domain-containing protein n=1 Tax=Amycolatopsis ultiminotia TaxID=543629 RepID=A0ABP6X464_9PSEU
MTTSDDIPQPPRDDRYEDPHRTPAEITAIVERLWSAAQAHTARLDQLHERLSSLEAHDETDPRRTARWLAFPAPPAAEDPEHESETPLFTIAHFVQYYNQVYTGRPGSRAVAIPDCWLDHPGLLAELATLTYTWREAHLGKHANVRDAQNWHDRWRPGFAHRLATEWTHPHCLTAIHKPIGTTNLHDRYTTETAGVVDENSRLTRSQVIGGK